MNTKQFQKEYPIDEFDIFDIEDEILNSEPILIDKNTRYTCFNCNETFYQSKGLDINFCPMCGSDGVW